MRVKSNYKDYYDYVEFLYSPKGGDSSETYLRRGIRDVADLGANEGNGELTVTLEVKGTIPRYPVPALRGYRELEEFPWVFKWCSFCGKLYLLVADCPEKGRGDLPMGPFKVIREDHPLLSKARLADLWEWQRKEPLFDKFFALPNEACLNLSKRMNEPVFLIETFSEIRSTYDRDKVSVVVVERQVPNLGNLGFPTFLPPEQAYQEIFMFLGQLKDNPDKNPPVNVSDKDRLIQKGFDSKLSFRGKPSN